MSKVSLSHFSTESNTPESQEGKLPVAEAELVTHGIWTSTFLWVSVTCLLYYFRDSPTCFEKDINIQILTSSSEDKF